MIVGTVSLTTIGALMNFYVLVPAYAQFFMPMEKIIAMGKAVNSKIDGLGALILFATVPFNFLKGVVCSIVTSLVYKRVSPILHKDFSKKS
jgi:riboflavin transporter FmnP